MQRTPKHSEARAALYFRGLRWPFAAGGRPTVVDIPRADGAPAIRRQFVTVAVAYGEGRRWEPQLNDATWRALADLRLGDTADCARFVNHRGDPYGDLKPGRLVKHRGEVKDLKPGVPVSTTRWFYLAEALRVAAGAWAPRDEDGTSFPVTDPAKRREAGRFLQHPAAMHLMAFLDVVPNQSGIGLGVSAHTLAGFMVARAALALEHPLPMRRCLQCGFWFELFRCSAKPISARRAAEPFTTNINSRRIKMASSRKSITARGPRGGKACGRSPAPNGKTQRRTKNFGSQKEARAHAQQHGDRSRAQRRR